MEPADTNLGFIGMPEQQNNNMTVLMSPHGRKSQEVTTEMLCLPSFINLVQSVWCSTLKFPGQGLEVGLTNRLITLC